MERKETNREDEGERKEVRRKELKLARFLKQLRLNENRERVSAEANLPLTAPAQFTFE